MSLLREVLEDQPDPGCQCRGCWKRYRVDVLVPDDLWEKISGGDAMLCGVCIMRRIEERSGFSAYKLEMVE